MKNYLKTYSYIIFLLALGVVMVSLPTLAMEAAHKLAQKEKPLLLDTLKDLVNIESGSYDPAGLRPCSL